MLAAELRFSHIVTTKSLDQREYTWRRQTWHDYTLIANETKMEGDRERDEMKMEQGLKETNEGYNDGGIKAGRRSGDELSCLLLMINCMASCFRIIFGIVWLHLKQPNKVYSILGEGATKLFIHFCTFLVFFFFKYVMWCPNTSSGWNYSMHPSCLLCYTQIIVSKHQTTGNDLYPVETSPLLDVHILNTS